MNLIDIFAVIAALIAIIAVAISILKGLDWLTVRRKWSPEKERLYEDDLNSRLLHPRFSELEAYFKTSIPDDLRQLYADTDLLLKRDFFLKDPNTEDNEHFVQHFLPADSRSVEETWGPKEMRFPFAVDDFVNYYCVPMDCANPERYVVYFVDQEKGEALPIAKCLGEFLSWQTRNASEE